MRPGSQHLSLHQRVLVHTTGWLLLATGVAWLTVHYTIGAGAGELPQPSEAWLIRLHALAAWVATFALGELAAQHVPRGWRTTHHRRETRQRRLGIALCTLAVALVASGYALMYLVPEPTHAAWGLMHSTVGIAMAAVLVAHRSGVAMHQGPS
ncbi:MAG: hypothetical protein HS128_02175 [Ideonella sp.]|nr:hypothetical protein [Ideonella sp.]MCC7458548.1 hypothetical protein [Nitrospira sp.]